MNQLATERALLVTFGAIVSSRVAYVSDPIEAIV
jgi:hypothetical protein